MNYPSETLDFTGFLGTSLPFPMKFLQKSEKISKIAEIDKSITEISHTANFFLFICIFSLKFCVVDELLYITYFYYFSIYSAPTLKMN